MKQFDKKQKEQLAYKEGTAGYNRISGTKTLQFVALLISTILILCVLSVYLIINQQ